MKEILHTRSHVICYGAGKRLSVSHLFSSRIVFCIACVGGTPQARKARVRRLAQHRTAASQADNSLGAMRKGQANQCQSCLWGEGPSDLQIAGSTRKLGESGRLAGAVTRAVGEGGARSGEKLETEREAET